MATTSGRVQRLIVIPGTGSTSTACTSIGPTSSSATLLFIQRNASDPDQVGAFKSSMVDALASALAGRQTVTATHGSTSSEITQLQIDAS
jgi:hypothetical protein